MHNSIVPYVLLILCVNASSLFAQEKRNEWEDIRRQAVLRYTGSTWAGLNESGTDRGRVRSDQSDFSYQERFPLAEAWKLILGAGYKRTNLGLGAGAPLPGLLQGVNARVGGEWRFDPRWTGAVLLSPGVYGDANLGDGDFKMPASVSAHFTQRPGLHWIGGLAFGGFGRRAVTPFFGVIWRIDPRWNLRLVPPLARVEYRVIETARGPTDLFLGAGFDGSRHRVSSDLGTRVGRPELNGDQLSVQQAEARTGVSASWDFIQGELSAGWQFLRRYKYENSGVTLKAGNAALISAGLSARF